MGVRNRTSVIALGVHENGSYHNKHKSTDHRAHLKSSYHSDVPCGDLPQVELKLPPKYSKAQADVAWLTYRWNKPLAARLLAAPGKRLGEFTEFANGILADTVVQPLPGGRR